MEWAIAIVGAISLGVAFLGGIFAFAVGAYLPESSDARSIFCGYAIFALISWFGFFVVFVMASGLSFVAIVVGILVLIGPLYILLADVFSLPFTMFLLSFGLQISFYFMVL